MPDPQTNGDITQDLPIMRSVSYAPGLKTTLTLDGSSVKDEFGRNAAAVLTPTSTKVPKYLLLSAPDAEVKEPYIVPTLFMANNNNVVRLFGTVYNRPNKDMPDGSEVSVGPIAGFEMRISDRAPAGKIVDLADDETAQEPKGRFSFKLSGLTAA